MTIKVEKGVGRLSCGNCGLSAEIEVPPVFGEVDVYGKFIDLYAEGRITLQEGVKGEDEGEGE
ncbi:hypothetical protein HS1genome_0143 [Sulfodiicoccus acidiphilus]|uniref:Uncharacterized protein n=2 Tax=Sulfodiicoccus acidiphilus TaxID=1670455 RepID=A0A348B0Q2_9CREN|nr:hypothetical protein HS1genome_0143 [Sulfodiicoccus acidiphilus]GGT86141.1 hypothetical protein GCM10007116_00050 [Sulfodiicoccus acidiphilus]